MQYALGVYIRIAHIADAPPTVPGQELGIAERQGFCLTKEGEKMMEQAQENADQAQQATE
jgi:hypothetical protein